MPRKPTHAGVKVLLAARVEPELRDRVDALQELFSSVVHRANRSDILRALICLGLEVVDDRVARDLPPIPSDRGLGLHRKA
ncbi:Hypothetical protein A7982_05129 [Minicystis rosea]|nr:Hypothetical protein A7982_05129 [Minicystis rosea]